MDVVHTLPYLAPEAGGTVRAVTQLCGHLCQHNINVHLLALNAGAKTSPPIIPAPPVNTVLVNSYLKRGLYPIWAPQFGRTLRKLVEKTDAKIVHDHGCWLPTNYEVLRNSQRMNLHLVISPHGMLEPWSLHRSRIKKRLAWHIFQKDALKRASVLHATSQAEAKNLRGLDLHQPIAVIPFGIDLPPIDKKARLPESSGRLTLLFLSRIHPKKGLLNLIKALYQTSTTDWHLVIAGPDENSHRSEIEVAVMSAGLQDRVSFKGSVDNQEKWVLYRQADLFVLPTFSENFGIVVAEALAAGLPVITTKGAPWQDLETHHCGWWIDVGIDPLVQALHSAMELSHEARERMGQNGRRLIEKKYSWADSVTKMLAVYRWILTQGKIPDCIFE